ncbi:hypothetical protein KGY71_02645 [Candidatus Bipolaricaulota bacterium]|nr:hypothetical protein [Candidatus Bipolaricaulota bacterium]
MSEEAFGIPVQTHSESIFRSLSPKKRAKLEIYTQDGKPAFQLQLAMASRDMLGVEVSQLIQSATGFDTNFIVEITVPRGWRGGFFQPDRLFLEIENGGKYNLGRTFDLSLHRDNLSLVSGSVFKCFMDRCRNLTEGDSYRGIYSFPVTSSGEQVKELREFLKTQDANRDKQLFIYYRGGGRRESIPLGSAVDKRSLVDTETTSGRLQTSSQNVGEHVQVSEAVAPGDVVGLDPEKPNHYRKTREPYSSLVAGVITERPVIELGNVGKASDGPILVLSGRARVNASAENGPIAPGDLLTTSSKPGYAMVCKDRSRCSRAIVGKALERLKEDEGKISLLVVG